MEVLLPEKLSLQKAKEVLYERCRFKARGRKGSRGKAGEAGKASAET